MANTEREADDFMKYMRLMALATLEAQPLKRQISLLSKAGFGPSQIADLLGTTSNTVNVRLSEMRKEAKKNENTEGQGVRRTRRSQAH